MFFPAAEAADYSATIAKATVAAIPLLGGPAAEIFGAIIAPALGRRPDEWFEQLRLTVNDLARRANNVTWESLLDNESFTSALLQATAAALKTSAKDKVGALRNAVLDVAAGTGPDEDVQSLFLAFVDALTPVHLRLVRLIAEQRTVTIPTTPDWLKGNYCHQAIRELLDRGLVEAINNATRQFLMTGQYGVYQFNVKVSHNREDFVRFLTAPAALTAITSS